VFSPDSRLLAVVAEDSGVRLIRLQENPSERVVALHLNPGLMSFDPTGTRLAVAQGRRIDVVHVDTGESNGSFRVPGRIRWMEWSPDGQSIAVATRNQMALEIRDASTGELTLMISLQAPANRFVFHPDGHLLAVATEDGWVTLWRLPAVRKLIEMEGDPRVLQFSAAGNRFAVAGRGDEIITYELAPSGVCREFAARSGESSESALGLDLSPDGRWLATSDANGIRVWESGVGTEVTNLTQRIPQFTLASFAEEGHALVVNPVDQGVFRRSFEVVESDGIERLNLGPVETLLDRPGVRWWPAVRDHALVVDPRDQTVHLWSPRTPRALRQVATLDPGHSAKPSLNPDGRYLLLLHSPEGQLEVWSTKAASLLCTLPGGPYTGGVFTPDGQYLLTATASELRLWDINGWRPQPARVQELQRGESDCLQFSPDGTMLMVQSAPDVHRFYSYPSLTEQLEVTTPLACSRHHCAISSDNRRWYLLTHDNRLLEWKLSELKSQLRSLGLLDLDGTQHPTRSPGKETGARATPAAGR